MYTKETYLGNETVSELNVTGHCMGQTYRNEINVSLNLMQHSISVGHVTPVLHAGASVSTNHMVKLFLDFG